jgi:hypothetical protein
MAWTQAQLDALEDAMASGALTVKHSDKTITYRSLDDMRTARDLIKRSLDPDSFSEIRYVQTRRG